MPKVRVYELAKEFGIDSKIVLARLMRMGEFVRSASSTVDPTLRHDCALTFRVRLYHQPPGQVPTHGLHEEAPPTSTEERRAKPYDFMGLAAKLMLIT